MVMMFKLIVDQHSVISPIKKGVIRDQFQFITAWMLCIQQHPVSTSLELVPNLFLGGKR